MRDLRSAHDRNSVIRKGNGELILVVDDQKSVLDMASTIFEINGYQVIVAMNAFVAVETYEKSVDRIKVVLVDIAMPVMDGVALAEILVGINPAVKIIASTGHTNESREGELRSLGVTAFLPKPYNASQLLAIVYRTIHGLKG